jgi:hypothetical protein
MDPASDDVASSKQGSWRNKLQPRSFKWIFPERFDGALGSQETLSLLQTQHPIILLILNAATRDTCLENFHAYI